MSASTLQRHEFPSQHFQARFLAGLLAFALLVAACTWFSLTLTRFDGGVAVLWVANGLLTGTLLLTPRSRWGGWFAAAALGQGAARILLGDEWWLAVVLVAINLAECGIVAAWVRRRGDALGEGRSLGGISRDALVAAVVACAISASIAAPLLISLVSTSLLVTWWSWYASHLMGLAIVATLTVCALQPRVGLFGRAGMRVDYVLCLVLLLVTCYGVFWVARYPTTFVTALPLMFLVWRHGFSGMIVGVVVVAGMSGVAAMQHSAQFPPASEATALLRILFWQLYVAACCLLAYSTAVAMARRRQLERRLLNSEARYRQLAEDAERLARFDVLTGLANRRQFDETLAASTARAHRTGTPLLLLLLDLDHFKQINDSLGHACGDAVLKEFAHRIRDTVFDVDLVARLGGDEFVVLVEYTATREAGELIAARLLEAMRAPFRFEGRELDVGASIGVGLHAPVQSATKLMALADKALYEAKAKGRKTFAFQAG